MNKFQFMGRLTRDPEIKMMESGKTITLFSIAVNRRFNNSDVNVDFFNIATFGKTAEFAGKYFAKGKQVLLEGRIENKNWEKDGEKRQSTQYIAEQVYFADTKANDMVVIEDTDNLPF